MRIEHHDDVAVYYERVTPFLLEREAEHNLQLGFRSTLERNPHAWGPDDPVLLAAVEGDRVVGAATQTPPHNLVLSAMGPAAVHALAEELRGHDLPGVTAPVEVGKAFVERWPAPSRVGFEERIFRTDTVTAPRPTAGAMRPYRADDRQIVAQWIDAFAAEAMPGMPARDGDRDVELLLERGSAIRFWEDGARVSLLAYGSPTPNGMRIGPVYTPPELRGRGYASALTAAATREILDGGRRFAFLVTDLANQTSNSIYRRIGYRPVIDVNVWWFDRA